MFIGENMYWRCFDNVECCLYDEMCIILWLLLCIWCYRRCFGLITWIDVFMMKCVLVCGFRCCLMLSMYQWMRCVFIVVIRLWFIMRIWWLCNTWCFICFVVWFVFIGETCIGIASITASAVYMIKCVLLCVFC